MTNLILVRHGQTNSNIEHRWQGWLDTPLNELGRVQAAQVAQRLSWRKGQIHTLYSSPLARAYHTAKPIAAALDLPIHLVEGLKEFHFGEVEGLTTPQFQARFPQFFEKWQDKSDTTFAYPGGESRAGFYERVGETMDCIVARHPEDTLVVVAHGGTLRAILTHYFPQRQELWQDFSAEHCSLTHLRLNGRGAEWVEADAQVPDVEF